MLLTKLTKVAAFLVLATISVGTVAYTLAVASDEPSGTPAANPVEQNQPMVGDVKPKADAGGPVHSLAGHKDRIRSVAYSSDGQCIASASWDGTVRLWDPKTGKEVRRLDVPPTASYNPAYLSQVLFSPDGEFVVVAQQSGPDEPGVIVWNRRTGERLRDFPGQYVTFAPDGKHIACSGWGTPTPTFRLYEFATGKLVREIHSPYSRIEGLVYSRDGRMLFAYVGIPRPLRANGLGRLGDDPAEMRAWDVATGKERRTGLDEKAGSLSAFSPDGRTFALGVSLWETATGGGRVGLTGDPNTSSAFAFSPDGRTVAAGMRDDTVRLWDLPSGKEIGRFGKEVERGKAGWVLAVAFSPDGRSLVSGGLDVAKGGRIPSTAHIWDVSKITGRPRVSVERSAAELEADWKDLGGDAAKGYAALGRLVSSPNRPSRSWGSNFSPQSRRIPSESSDLSATLMALASRSARRRRKSWTALGEFAVPFVQKALAGNPSVEVRRRLEALLTRLEAASLSTETIRQIRAAEVLESIGNPEAHGLPRKARRRASRNAPDAGGCGLSAAPRQALFGWAVIARTVVRL